MTARVISELYYNMRYHPRTQMSALDSMRSSYTNIEKDSKLTATSAGYCC